MALKVLRPAAPRSCACSPMTSSVRIMESACFPRSAEALIVQRLGASQYRPEGRNNNEYYRPLQRNFRRPGRNGHDQTGQAMTGQRRQPDKRRNLQLFAAALGWFATAAGGAESQVTEGFV